MEKYLWAIPLLPLLGAGINGFGALTGALSRRAVNIIACTVVGIAFVLACLVNWELAQQAGHGGAPQLVSTWFEWIAAGSFSVDAALLVDPLAGVMLLVVTGVGFLIHVYSTGYMAHDPAYARYFAFINLFTFAMLLLVMGENLVLMFVGWEGVGLCSYLLIGFWFTDTEKAYAGKKAFVVNRVGDFGFLLGLFVLYWGLKEQGIDATLSIVGLREIVGANAISGAVITTVCLLLFVGATGKSAQIPLYVWLPDAMAGPTPVSALIHAATMVTAGVYMISRLSFLYLQSPLAMTVVACVGAATALYAATIGLTQFDIKKVLAYSTVSQLGYMFLAVGLGAFSAGIFHLVTHAFFKACLFLGSGAVIHAMGGEQDIRRMGGLRAKIPYTYWTFLLATIAIAGVFGTSGFMSKDEILAAALAANPDYTLVPGWLLYSIGTLGALLTTFYMFRLVFLTFFGDFRGGKDLEHHVHESPWSMVVPLIVLAALSIVGGLMNVPEILHGDERLHHWLSGAAPSVARVDVVGHGAEIGLMVALQVLILGTIALAYRMYLKSPAIPQRAAKVLGGVPYRLSYHKYYVDEIYDTLIVRPLHSISRVFLWGNVDVKIVDGSINGMARVVRYASDLLGRLQTGQLNGYAFSIVVGMVAILAYVAVK